jgi:hypothetical protein
MRHKGIGAAVAVCALATAAILTSSCSNSGSNGNGGKVRMILGGGSTQAATLGPTQATTLSDGSGRTIDSASISLSSILARNLDGQLIDVSMALPVTLDIIQLIQGRTVELPIGTLPVGSYDQLVIVIRSLHVGLSDGTLIDVTPPGGGWTAIVRTDPFEVVDGSVTTVHLHFRSDRAFQWINNHLEFDPEFDCTVEHGDDHGDGDDDD